MSARIWHWQFAVFIGKRTLMQRRKESTGHLWKGRNFTAMSLWGAHPPLSSQPQLWNILRCKKVGSDALTLAPGDPGGPRGPIGPCQSNRGKVRCCTRAIGSEMIVYVCVAYHGSRHRHGRRFVVVAMGHLRGEVLEEGEKERNKNLDPSVVWHRDCGFKLFHG